MFKPGIIQYQTGDADALAFLTAAGITDATITAAINTLVVALKGYGIWTKCKAIYPFVGGTAATHKWNLKDPRDLDAAFRLSFTGGWTHASTGALPNGTTGYADTFLSPNSILTNFNTHISLYSRTNSAGQRIDMGSDDVAGAAGKRICLHLKWSDNNFYGDMNSYTNGRITYSMAAKNSTGLFILNRTANNVQNAFINSNKIGTNTATETYTLPTYTINIGRTNGSTTWNSNREFAFSSIGDGLSDTEAANFYTAVQAFQTTLTRNI